MKIISSYSVKIKHYNRIFNDTVKIYREAVDFFIQVCLSEWENISELSSFAQLRFIEMHTHSTKNNPIPRYPFDHQFYKFPSYLRRSAISAAIGKVSSYKSNLANYEAGLDKSKPSSPRAGHSFPAMYKDNCFERSGIYAARLKVYIRNTWDWLDVELKKERCRLHQPQMQESQGMFSRPSEAWQGMVP